MKEFLLILAVAVVVVAFLMVGLSITRIRKGRDLQGDVGSNDEMKKKGLECTSKAFRREEQSAKGASGRPLKDCEEDCGSCGSCSGH